MQTVAVGWQVYEVTHNPLDLGLIGLSQFLPFVLLILPAGHFADSHDRRRILVGLLRPDAASARCCCSGLPIKACTVRGPCSAS